MAIKSPMPARITAARSFKRVAPMRTPAIISKAGRPNINRPERSRSFSSRWIYTLSPGSAPIGLRATIVRVRSQDQLQR